MSAWEKFWHWLGADMRLRGGYCGFDGLGLVVTHRTRAVGDFNDRIALATRDGIPLGAAILAFDALGNENWLKAPTMRSLVSS
jgi:hypothetical protein